MLAVQLSRLGYRWSDFHVCASEDLDDAIATHTPRVVVPLDQRTFAKLTGEAVTPMLYRGYVWPEVQGRAWVVPVLPPAFFRADPGMMLTFLSDITKAAKVAEADPFEYLEVEAVWKPSRSWWDAYVRDFLLDPTRPLAADIETPWKRRSEMSEAEKASGEDITYTIDEINFAYRDTQGVSVPWEEPYIDGAIAMMQASQQSGMTLFWNGAYDMPRIEHNSPVVFNTHHTRDTMDAFRVLRNCVSRKLVVATSLLPSCWNVQPTKHLGTSSPLYRAMDVVTLLRNDQDVMALLEAEGAMPAYDLFIRTLDPLLWAMSKAGVLTDAAKVGGLMADIRSRLATEQQAMTALVPEEIRPLTVWKTRSAAEKGRVRMIGAGDAEPSAELIPVSGEMKVGRCGGCGEIGVTAAHTRKKTLDAADAVL